MDETKNAATSESCWEYMSTDREEDGIRYLDVKEPGGFIYTAAGVDMQTGRVFYSDTRAQSDIYAQAEIQELVKIAQDTHPYSIERLEVLLIGAVAHEVYEAESGEGLSAASDNLTAMGFTREEMRFFGLPDEVPEGNVGSDIMRQIGVYDFRGQVDITDPCYNRSVWCRINNLKIANGKYLCAIRERDEGEWGIRVSTIGIYSLEFPVPDPNQMKCIGNIGVDAGLAGFFHHKKNFNEDEWTQFCNKLYPIAKPHDRAWIDYGGFFSSSGFGDGSYDVYAYYGTEDNQITALEIRFLDDEDEDDEGC